MVLVLSTGGIQSACLSEGQRVGMKIFSKLWELGEWSETQYVIADKGYDYSAVRTTIKKAKKPNHSATSQRDFSGSPRCLQTLLSYAFCNRALFWSDQRKQTACFKVRQINPHLLFFFCLSRD